MANPIVSVGVSIEDSDPEYEAFRERFDDPASHVDIGIHAFSGQELVTIASTNEFGTTRAGKNNSVTIPARPFVRSTVDENREKYENMAKVLWGKIVDGGITISKGLGLAGLMIETDIRKKIVDLRDPPNAPATLHPSVGGTNPRGKKSDNPLIDEGTLVSSVRFAVKTDDDQVLEVSDT